MPACWGAVLTPSWNHRGPSNMASATIAPSNVPGVIARVEQTINEYKLFGPGQKILVAVSGGVDSMVLLHLLHTLAVQYGWRLAVAHFNHRLRGRASTADERFSHCASETLGLPFFHATGPVRGYARSHGLSIEMAARALRHEFLARTARDWGCRAVALAHQKDDQRELFLLRLMRGAGGEGLSGMKLVAPSPADPAIDLVRPMLRVDKVALKVFASARQIPFREDASNASSQFLRNRIRNELVPLLKKDYQSALDAVLDRAIEILGSEADLISGLARDWLAGESRRRLPFDRLHVALQRRVIQLQLIDLGVSPAFELVEALRKRPDQVVCVSPVLPKGALKQVARSENFGHSDPTTVVRTGFGSIRLQKPLKANFKKGEYYLDLEGECGVAEFAGLRFTWEKTFQLPKRLSAIGGQEWFDADRVGSTLLLRHWRPGDRFRPIGMAGNVKLQDIFSNLRIPREQRHRLVVAVSESGEIVWVQGVRISEQFKLTMVTHRGLLWRWKAG